MGTLPFLDEVLSAFAAVNKDSIDTFERLSRPGTKIFVIGKNQEAKAVAAALPVAGLVDDFSALPSTWNGIEVVRAVNLPAGAVVVNCSTSISPLSVSKRLKSTPGVYFINYTDLCREESLGLPLPGFVSEARKSVLSDETKYRNVMELLCDEESKHTFRKLISYRLTAMPYYMEGFQIRLNDQYFEGFAKPLERAVFVDCGGFDGDTSSEFIKRCPNYGRIYIFEPDKLNFEKAQRRLAGLRDIHFISKGVSDFPGRLSFEFEKGSASAVSNSSGQEIEVTTLDYAIEESVSFIKMDLEGWEIPALKGSRSHIQQDRPILALAAYHKVTDFLEIPELVLSVRADYDLYLRHYTEGWSESVYYFVPK